ncbi:hypothetical protein OB955_18075 [Halobacteria archaeon AArc-m2/3/4]|uniref:40-residue YVTN family beta-propeller repeat-containing protein n=1 Tax=Natronoglomus mannanivorans TaxID=2979990 RepID=A0ABT2QI88_9EURY|nr:hypothetical protein [Halobacteria archaeon AArc-m2/3/4]
MERPVTRRRFVQATSGGLAVGVAGCLGSDDDDDAGGNGDDHDHDDHGDDDHDHNDETATDAPGSDGLAYAFAPDRIAIVDPEAGEVVDELTDGISSAEWGDTRLTRDRDKIFAIENSLEQVVVIDTETRELIERVDIGPGATHMYHPVEDEMWAHADDEGAFYVIDTDSLAVTEIVDAGLEGEGHGKLLAHEDFGTKAYATNVNDPAALIVDLEAYERTGSIDLGEEGGTHYKAYAPRTGLAYFERSGGVGTTAVVDTATDEVVDELPFSGGMSLTPDEERMGILDGDELHLLDMTDEESEEIGSVTVEGGPDALGYHEVDGTLYGFTANTTTPDVAVVDVDALEVVDRLEAGDIERPDGAHHLHRSGVTGGGYFFTPADADGTVAIVDMAARALVGQVPVGEGVARVQYVGGGTER